MNDPESILTLDIQIYLCLTTFIALNETRRLLMTKCELTEKCIFFNDRMANMPVTASMYKKTFCIEKPEECARHLVFETLGRDKVPQDLFPNQKERVKDIIGK
jgi:hypothetical protein